MSHLHLQPDYAADGEPFRHTWEGMLNIDQFRWMVRGDVQKQLAMAHDELGGRHVRAVGMLDDEMKVLGPDPTGFRNRNKKGPRVNWQVVNYVIDSLLEIGISPMFTTTFTPSVMASGEETVFSTKSHVSPPEDLKAWADLIHDGVRHFTNRYGNDVLRDWYFEVWNEPNLEGFWAGSQAEFFDLWRTTFHAIKDVDPAYRVGGPSTARAEWIGDLIEFGRKHDCEPDYIITHIYNNDSESKPLSPFAGPQEDKVSKSPNFAAGVVRGVHELLEKLDYSGEVHWNEWGRSWFPHYPERETANEAAFVVKTMAEVSQLAHYFAYWNLSDIYDQVGYGAETFHGNYGMLNLQGLRKPQYHAFQLMTRLGDRRLPTGGDGLSDLSHAIVTRTERGFAVMVYAFDPAGRLERHAGDADAARRRDGHADAAPRRHDAPQHPRPLAGDGQPRLPPAGPTRHAPRPEPADPRSRSAADRGRPRSLHPHRTSPRFPPGRGAAGNSDRLRLSRAASRERSLHQASTSGSSVRPASRKSSGDQTRCNGQPMPRSIAVR